MESNIQSINSSHQFNPIADNPPTQKFLFFNIPKPESKIKCLSGRVLSQWADVRSSTKNEILITRIICAAGRFIGAAIISFKVGFIGALWHTAAAVVQLAASLFAGMIYYSSRLGSRPDAPKVEWQIKLEKFTQKMGVEALHHLGSGIVDFIRATGIGAWTTAFHFAATPEDYFTGQSLNWTKKPSSIDTVIPLLFL